MWLCEVERKFIFLPMCFVWHTPIQAQLTHKAQEQLPRISKFMWGCTFGAVCKNAHLNPGTGLAFIRLCEHAHFSITVRGRTYNSPHLHQKMLQKRIQFLQYFFIQSAGLAYHHRTKCGGYDQPYGLHIITL